MFLFFAHVLQLELQGRMGMDSRGMALVGAVDSRLRAAPPSWIFPHQLQQRFQCVCWALLAVSSEHQSSKARSSSQGRGPAGVAPRWDGDPSLGCLSGGCAGGFRDVRFVDEFPGRYPKKRWRRTVLRVRCDLLRKKWEVARREERCDGQRGRLVMTLEPRRQQLKLSPEFAVTRLS